VVAMEKRVEQLPKFFIQYVWLLQLLCAFAICINHLHFSLIKGVRLSPFWENEPTLLGITFLAFSTGILSQIHLLYDGKKELASQFIAGRFIRLWWPVFLVVMVDIHFNMVESGDGLTTSWPLLSVFTLSHTWIYNVFDGRSIPLPLGVSNLIWVGSCLFGLFIFHGITKNIWLKLSNRSALILLLISGLISAIFFTTVDFYSIGISTWSTEKYGELAGPYQLVNWLLLYNPYAELGNYLCGVAFAQLMFRESWQISKRNLAILSLFSVLLIVIPTSNFPKYLGVGLILSLVVVIFAGKVKKGENEIYEKMKYYFFRFITPISFEIIIFHIMIYDLFPLDQGKNASSNLELVTRVIGVNILMIGILVVLHQLLLIPIMRSCEKFLKISQSDDRHI
jgi:hypothetical protein